MKSNADKCHLLVSTSNKVIIRIDNFDISNSKCEKLLGVKFEFHLRIIYPDKQSSFVHNKQWFISYPDTGIINAKQ